MRAGRLRHRVTVRQLVRNPDGSLPVTDMGAPTEAREDLATRWARVRPLRGRERFAAQQANAEVTHEIQMRYFEGLSADMVIEHRGRTFDIKAILNPEERDRETVLLCVERRV